MSDVILNGDVTIHYAADNNRQAVEWTGAATGTRTVNELYSATQRLLDDPAQMDDLTIFKADTPDIYRIQNQWFIDDTTVEHLKGGSIFSDKWKDGTTEHILIIGYAQTTEFAATDIGRTIRGTTTTDTGTILDFNATRNVLWIRPDDPLAAGDEFDNGTEAYTIPNSALGAAVVDDAGVFTDDTADANSPGDGDFLPFPAVEQIGDGVLFGFRQEFNEIVVDNGSVGGVAGTVGVVAWQYWNGSAWTALAGVVDGTSSFTAVKGDGKTVTFTVPTDWAKRTAGTSPSLYFIRADVTTVFTINPVLDQAFIGSTGVGSFLAHTRHGTGSAAGESAWAGITTIGTIETNTHLYIAQENIDALAGGFSEVNLTAAKATSDWWGDGQIDLMVKTLEAASVIGKLPGSVPSTGVITVFARQYSKTYSHFIATGLATAGGNTVVPLSTGDDLDNTTGHRTFTGSAGTGTFTVDEVISKAGTTKKGVITAVAGTSGAPILTYYLIDDPQTDFVNGDTLVTGASSGATTTAGVPATAGPATDTNITFAHAAITRDINENGTADPYSIDLSNVAQKTMALAYERSKFLTRRGETASASTDGQEGQFYIGSELQIQYDTQTGNFAEGLVVTGGTSSARGVVVADHDAGADGDLILRQVRGTFQVAEIITDTGTGSATIAAAGLRTITPVSAAPFGTFPGASKFFMAAGLTPTAAQMAAGEAQKFSTIDDDGNTKNPPNKQTVEVTNLISGDTVSIMRRTGTAIDKTQFTLAAGNNQGNSTLVMNGAIASDNPNISGSKVRVISASGAEHRYRIASYTASTFTLAAASTGSVTAGGTDTLLIDSAATFTTDAVEVGDYVRNITNNVFVRVVSVDSQTQLTTEAGGSWTSTDTYTLNTLVQNYAAGDNAYAPLIERIADATSETTTVTYSADFNIRADVRRTAATAIIPFAQDSSVISTGRSIAAVRSADSILV